MIFHIIKAQRYSSIQRQNKIQTIIKGWLYLQSLMHLKTKTLRSVKRDVNNIKVGSNNNGRCGEFVWLAFVFVVVAHGLFSFFIIIYFIVCFLYFERFCYDFPWI